MNIENKVVLITGANRGIGRALVDEALARGARRVYQAARGAAPAARDRMVPLALDVTRPDEIDRATREVETLDLLINNAGLGLFDDLGDIELVEQHLRVNLLGPLRLTQAFLPQLRRARGAVLNNLSLAAVAAVPVMPGYSISKAAAFNMTQSLRAILAHQGVSVHAALLGPIDTDMSRPLEIPKATAEAAARGILDGLARGEEEIFPDPASQYLAPGWHASPAKTLERQFAAFVPATAGAAA